MNVLIFGLGIHGGGLERARFFLSHGDTVRITDSRTKEELGSGVDYLESLGAQVSVGCLKKEDFLWADIVVKTQSIKLDNEYLAFAKKVTNDFSCFFKSPLLIEKNIKLIIVSGNRSNRTITASAICHGLRELGRSARMCGSMGTSPLTELSLIEQGDTPEFIILEMSSWQLRDTSFLLEDKIPNCELAVFDIVENNEKVLDLFLRKNEVNKLLCSKKLPISKIQVKNVFDLDTFKKRKPSDIPKTMSTAYSVLKVLGYPNIYIKRVLSSFKGIPGRGELLLRTDKVMYYNDSAATIPQAVVFSVQNFESLPVHIICGGGDGLLDASPMTEGLEKCASIHLLNGIFTEKCLIPSLKAKGISYFGPFDSMDKALASAESCLSVSTEKMEVVIFSPGCMNFSQMSSPTDWETQFDIAVNSKK